MSIYQYLLKDGNDFVPIQSTESIGQNAVIRRLKPPDDRSIHDGFRAHPDDYTTWRVTAVDTCIQERPDGGFEQAKILHIQREYPDEQPQSITLGG